LYKQQLVSGRTESRLMLASDRLTRMKAKFLQSAAIPTRKFRAKADQRRGSYHKFIVWLSATTGRSRDEARIIRSMRMIFSKSKGARRRLSRKQHRHREP